eukprot:TRINITY_DN74034_c0_g1_i1.p1 TRINITY_DN74034_c0_g1~~TRINITY_DN74034_c0_g1_i1.p1  ORF type:complete len:531 (-),score=89.05 TRINITY_DN74034_c0_g1_i1:571-2013(-)
MVPVLDAEFRSDALSRLQEGSASALLARAERHIRGGLAKQQATIYDERYHIETELSATTNNDKAGVEEVKDVMETEAAALRREVSRAATRCKDVGVAVVTILDFGCGDGRYLFEFCRVGDLLREDALRVSEAKSLSESFVPRAHRLRIVGYDVSRGALAMFQRRAVEIGFEVHDMAGDTASADGNGVVAILRRGNIEIQLLVGNALLEPTELEALLHSCSVCDGSGGTRGLHATRGKRCFPFDIIVSGWGSISAIPNLAAAGHVGDVHRQECFLKEFALLAPVFINVVSSANNFVKHQLVFQALRDADATAEAAENEAIARAPTCASLLNLQRQRDSLAARLRLATAAGDFYYPVEGNHLSFYSAVTPALERARLFRAGYEAVEIQACNVVSFRDIMRSQRMARIERAVIKCLRRGDSWRLQLLLSIGIAKLRKIPRSTLRLTPIFVASSLSPLSINSGQTDALVTQVARYIISISSVER